MERELVNIWGKDWSHPYHENRRHLKEKYKVKDEDLVYRNGEYEIYKFESFVRFVGTFDTFLYAWKGIVFNHLQGLNKNHLDMVASRNRPLGEYGPSHFLYDRAVENLNKIQNEKVRRTVNQRRKN